MPEISVIICTYNPRADYLRRTLNALKEQTLPSDRWELLLIDNASNEPLTKLWDISWHPHARPIREDELGLTAARLRGIRESSGKLLVFVDDDNVLAPDFLAQVLEIASQYPSLGAFGAGAIEPEFEVDPGSDLTRLLPLLALRRVDHPRWSNCFNDYETIPWGAGLCVTHLVAAEYSTLLTKLVNTSYIDRRGDHLFCGGDDLFSFASCRLGDGFGVFPSLRVTHLIPQRRLTREYFLRLLGDKNISSAILRYELLGVEPEKISLPQLMHILIHGLRNGGFSMRCRWMRIKGEGSAARILQQSHVGSNGRDLTYGTVRGKS